MKQQITKRAITESFRALLAVKPLHKITVRDIVEDCGLTRNTFYYHYEDIYDLLSDVISRILSCRPLEEFGSSCSTFFRA